MNSNINTKNIKVAYCTGFWCTNIGNGFFSMGVEHALQNIFGEQNVTIVSDLQTYTTSYGKRLYPHKNQLEYIANLDVDYVVLAGPVLSKYFLLLWKDILLTLRERGIGYMILSAGFMKLPQDAEEEIIRFFDKCPPYVFTSRDKATYDKFASHATHSYDGICFSFFTPDCYHPCGISGNMPYWVFNFDKLPEPEIGIADEIKNPSRTFEYNDRDYGMKYSGLVNNALSKTDRFTDALIYIRSIFPQKQMAANIGQYTIIRTDHRFHPHFRSKIYAQPNSFVADLPFAYLNLYANSELTISDRVHACAATLAFGGSAMLLAKTNRSDLLTRVGADGITDHPVTIDLNALAVEKANMVDWLAKVCTGTSSIRPVSNKHTEVPGEATIIVGKED